MKNQIPKPKINRAKGAPYVARRTETGRRADRLEPERVWICFSPPPSSKRKVPLTTQRKNRKRTKEAPSTLSTRNVERKRKNGRLRREERSTAVAGKKWRWFIGLNIRKPQKRFNSCITVSSYLADGGLELSRIGT